MKFSKRTIGFINAQLCTFFAWCIKFCGLSRNPVTAAGNITVKSISEKPERVKNIWQKKDLLFAHVGDSISNFFLNQQRKIGMEPIIRGHDLRHSHASLLINLGFSPDVVADRLGHANASMVLKVYGHMYPQKRIEVTTALNKMYQEQKKRLA